MVYYFRFFLDDFHQELISSVLVGSKDSPGQFWPFGKI